MRRGKDAMRRYEGMDELLQGVRERLQGAREPVQDTHSKSPFTYTTPVTSEAYDSVVGSLGILLREAEHVREMLTADETGGLSEEQRDHLRVLLGQVMEELWGCEAGLQGVR
jgi:hypothetical protein